MLIHILKQVNPWLRFALYVFLSPTIHLVTLFIHNTSEFKHSRSTLHGCSVTQEWKGMYRDVAKIEPGQRSQDFDKAQDMFVPWPESPTGLVRV